MKKLKTMSLMASLLFIVVLLLSACDPEALDTFWKNSIVDYEFSDDGFEEIEMFYTAFYEDTSYFTITWATTGEEAATLSWTRRIEGSKVQYSITYTSEEAVYRILKLSEDEVYSIDEKEKLYATKIMENLYFIEEAIAQCALKMTGENNEPLWILSKKTDNVPLVGLENEEYETVTYEYISNSNLSDDSNLKVYFDKKSFYGLFPVLRKIEYQFADRTLPIYIKNLPNSSEPDNFNVPTEELGYSLVE